MLITGMLALAAPTAEASTITDFLDRIGGCRKPLSESFSNEVSPYTAKPYGKPLAEWTNTDIGEFRAYFVDCQARRRDWQSIGDYNRNDAIRVIDTTMAELWTKVRDARGMAAKQRTDAASEARERERIAANERDVTAAAARQTLAQQQTDADVARRTEAARTTVLPLMQEMFAFAQNEMSRLPPAEQLARIDAYLARLQALHGEVVGTKVEAPLNASIKTWQEQRAGLAVQLGRDPSAAPGQADGPYTDFEWLGQQGLVALTNPLQRETYRTSLARGIDFNVGVSSIAASAAGWLVQLSGRLGSPGTPGQGFFCRVDGSDTASLAVLRGITPPYGIVHVAAAGVDEYVLENTPVHIRIVFTGCRVTPPDNGDPRRPN
ncbi:hypothetical protein [Methylobacterium sp. WL116]|uniref:hypothetical protein n=1 Tax=Methylobacterium sp. WL116 TaxID=2603889 RepID=UPI0011C8207C|nr:hypothetical protein [Methylobacterium sp. WL116]TXM90156.1 hypothetical protein FV223_19420 [Methylobacterium sp. WL116]